MLAQGTHLTNSGITIPPVMFITHLNLNNGRSQFDLAWMRFTDIVIGIAAAVLIGTFVWPNHARVRFLHAVSGSLEKLIDYCKSFTSWLGNMIGADLRSPYEQVRAAILHLEHTKTSS
jgi:uncharacterized membrane protein YccC